jgi:hypothetical protein
VYYGCNQGAAAKRTVSVAFAAFSAQLKSVTAALFSARPNLMWLGHCLIDEAKKIVLAFRFKAGLERLGAVGLRHEVYEPIFFFEVAAVPSCQGIERCDSERTFGRGRAIFHVPRAWLIASASSPLLRG